MNIITRINTIRLLVCFLSLVVGSAFAAHGGFGGGGVGHGGVQPGGGWNNGGYHGNVNQGYHHDDYDAGYNAGYDSGVVISVPNAGDYDSSCQTTQVCNSSGQCWSQQDCD
jgi:hypothetical protein